MADTPRLPVIDPATVLATKDVEVIANLWHAAYHLSGAHGHLQPPGALSDSSHPWSVENHRLCEIQNESEEALITLPAGNVREAWAKLQVAREMMRDVADHPRGWRMIDSLIGDLYRQWHASGH